jgi:hypothetical protein
MKKKVKAADAPPTALPPRSVSPLFLMKVVICSQLILIGLEFSPDFSTNGDDAKYYLLGKSLWSGNGYRDIFDPQNPVQSFYPPLFPGLIGGIGVLSHSPLVPKLAMGILSACIILLLFQYLKPLGPGMYLPVLLITALSYSLASHATLLMSEIPYLFAMLASLALLELYRRRGGKGVIFWAAALVAVTPTCIRTVGITFSAAWLLAVLIDKKYALAAVHAIFLVAGLLIVRQMTQGTGSYADALFTKSLYDPELGLVSAADLFSRVAQNINLLFLSLFPRALAGVPLPKNSAAALAVLLLIPVAIGWIRNFKHPTRILSFYLFFYVGMISLQQTQWVCERFLIPLIPFVALFLFQGLEFIAFFIFPKRGKPVRQAVSSRLKTVLYWCAAIGITATNLSGHLHALQSNTALTNDWKNFYSCADWIRLNAPADAIVANRKPELFYLRSQRKGFVYPYSHDVEKVVAELKRGGARYCVLDNFFWTNTSTRYLFPAIMSHPELFRVVYSLTNPDTYVLELRTP